MKIRKNLLIIFLYFFTVSLFSQTTEVNITGIIVEKETSTPIEQATVRLLNKKDSTLVRGVASSSNGRFNLINVRNGNYLLNISFIGYESVYKEIGVNGKQEIRLGKIEIEEESVLLNEVIVIAKAPEVVIKNDTIEYNADSFKTTEGAVLEDLLKKMPGVEIDSDGKITVNGKEIKKVMVDGKEFFSDDPKVASKNLPANMIDKVQTYDRKSDMARLTGFDDGEEEPVINLTVKPGMKRGWFGNAYGGYGSKDRYEGNVMVNRFIENDQLTFMGGINNTNNMGFSDLSSGSGGGFRGSSSGNTGNGITNSGNAGLNFSKEVNNKLSWTGSTRYSFSNNTTNYKSTKENYLPNDSTSAENNRSTRKRDNDNVAANFRMEWKPDTSTTIIFRSDFSYTKGYNWQEESFETLAGGPDSRDTANMGSSTYLTHTERYDLNAQLEYSRKMNAKGRVLSFSVSGGISNSDENGENRSDTYYFNNINGIKDEIIDQEIKYENNGFNYRAYLSWVEPLGRNYFLQATYSIRQNKQESLKYAYSRDEETGLYTLLDTVYSQSYRNNFINQRASISLKSQREKYNYTLGLNLDPSYSHSESFVGDSTLSTISRNILNFSPMAQFNYMFNKRTNLRINYNGRTSQPSMTQLQPVTDNSNPLNEVTGNPNLKPTYTNNLSIRFQQFTPEKQRAFMVMLNGTYTLNAIVSKTQYAEDKSGKRTTTYENVSGNYNGNIRVILNTPLKNKKFSINSMTMSSLNNTNGFINGEKNINKSFILSERTGINYRSNLFDLGLNGNISYNGITNTFQEQNNQNTLNYTIGGETTIYLPLNFKIESDLSYISNAGYAAAYKQQDLLWNASASKTFLKKNQATLRFKIYDILQQRSNINHTVTADYFMQSEYNTLSSYFMVHFIYRFSVFKGSGGAPEGALPGERRRNEPPPGSGRPPRF
ncbi:MAG: TonB-dependent receptor [Tannerellaceae bacterium]|nr:TonB-dependent receptor [Tannerellaceae bacterium]